MKKEHLCTVVKRNFILNVIILCTCCTQNKPLFYNQELQCNFIHTVSKRIYLFITDNFSHFLHCHTNIFLYHAHEVS